MAMIVDLRCEYEKDPIGIGTRAPRLSYQIQSDRPDTRQTAYRILVATHPALLAAHTPDMWDSGRVESAQSIQIVYGGRPLSSRTRYYWTVCVWDDHGQASGYAPAAYFQLGILEPETWEREGARWITAPMPRPAAELPLFRDKVGDASPCFVRDFSVEGEVETATLYITARGLYEAHLNGHRVSDPFAPGWTDYPRRLYHQSYDVTAAVRAGDNRLGVVLGDGWYVGNVSAIGRDIYHKGERMLLSLLDIRYADGRRISIPSDSRFRAGMSAVLFSDMLMGEGQDLARPFCPAGPLPAEDGPAVETVEDYGVVEPQRGPSVRLQERLSPRHIRSMGPGHYLVDMGQNMVGYARMALQGPAGCPVTIRYGEMCREDGSLYTENLRTALQTDMVYLSGQEDVFCPHFTCHGFRYMDIQADKAFTLGEVEGCVLYSDMEPAGTFFCSEPMINQLQRNIEWGQRGNFFSIPTDCPQRDERLGWLGDAQIFIRTAAENRNVAGFFTKWVRDLLDSQMEDGAFADTAPNICSFTSHSAAWMEAGVIVPYTLYRCYGDTRLLEESYPALEEFMQHCLTHSDGYIRPAEGYGDWLSVGADTPKEVLATAFFAYAATLMEEISRVLGKTARAAYYRELFTHIREAFQRAFVRPDGRIHGDTQTVYLLALKMRLLSPEQEPVCAAHLVEAIHEKDDHLSTGFVGVSYLLPMLSEHGYDDLAYQLLETDTYPSWGYSIRNGATTIWERWNSYTKEDGFGDVGMNSFNHYSLGSVGEWLYRYCAGIDLLPEEAAYASFTIHPHVGGKMHLVHATYRCPYGLIVSHWEAGDTAFLMEVEIPPQTTCRLVVPTDRVRGWRAGRRSAQTEAVYTLGSGRYRLLYTYEDDEVQCLRR